jgi:hypothetical protein
MSDTDRQLLIEKCGQLLHDVLVEVRNLSLQDGQTRRINDLTDLVHNIPLFMIGRDDHVLSYLRSGFVEYGRKYCPETDPAQGRYVTLLDMDEAAFAERYHRPDWAWPEPELTPAAG